MPPLSRANIWLSGYSAGRMVIVTTYPRQSPGLECRAPCKTFPRRRQTSVTESAGFHDVYARAQLPAAEVPSWPSWGKTSGITRTGVLNL